MTTAVVGAGLLVLGALAVWRIARMGVPYRAGPWPGLSPLGGVLLLGCALILAGGQLVLGAPKMPLPDVPILTLAELVPLALATRMIQMPGAASAACGAYLLPRAFGSFVDAGVDPPPLLLVPSLAFDISLWLRPGDFAALAKVWPRRRRTMRRAARHPRRHVRTWRGFVAGAVFGAVLAAIEPPFEMLLGADAALWYSRDMFIAGAIATAVSAVTGLAVRGTGSSPPAAPTRPPR